MKRLLTLLLILLPSFLAFAQDDAKSVTLDEITVNAAKVINKSDGMVIFPTEAQKQASTNGYNFLQKLSLANIRIDDVAHSVSALDNKGAVQLRINGIVVGKQEMMSLDPKTISKIDFIDNPGVRYGEEIGYVISITTRRADSGYTLGTDLTSSLSSLRGDGTVYGKWDSGKSELSLSYDISGNKLKGLQNVQVANYTLNDGSVYTIERNDVETFRKDWHHNAKLTYNWVDSTASVFQISFSGSLDKTPGDYSLTDIFDGTRRYTATKRENSKVCSPVVDLYFFRQITPRQSITANAVGTYISSEAGSYNDEGTLYKYDVNGKSTSLLSEVIYENRLKPFTLSTGLNYSYKHTKNDYLGDASAISKVVNNKLYAFGEIKGSLNNLRYTLGAGVSYINYTQNEHNYNFCTFRPKASVAYNISNGMQLSYTYQMWDQASRIAMTSDATIRMNSMEWIVGNPDLKPGRDMDHLLRFSYNTSRLQTFVQGYFKQCNKPNMALYLRTDDNNFIYTQINQKEIDLLHTMAYIGYWILPEKLQVAVNGGMQRCFNYGNDYTHCYTSWFYIGSMTAYLGNFSLMAYTDHGSRFLEGETKGYYGAQTSLQASYRLKDWQFSLTWTNPLCDKYKASESELLNRYLNKHTTEFDRDSGNMISLNISWRLSRGSNRKAADKRINLSDTDNGIISN